jgi:hypothetical protein
MALCFAVGCSVLSGGKVFMDWQVWFTLTIAALVFWGMVKNWFTPDVLLLGGVIMLALGGIVTPKEAFAGFANEGMLTVVALFIVAAALRETGALNIVGSLILGEVRTAPAALRRLALAVPTLSAFLNNTPIVAMMLPVVTDWCRKHHVAPSRLLIPLSFFTVLGGMCTVIGTSTNLVVSGLMTQAAASLPNGPVRQSLAPCRCSRSRLSGLPAPPWGSVICCWRAVRSCRITKSPRNGSTRHHANTWWNCLWDPAAGSRAIRWRRRDCGIFPACS